MAFIILCIVARLVLVLCGVGLVWLAFSASAPLGVAAAIVLVVVLAELDGR